MSEEIRCFSAPNWTKQLGHAACLLGLLSPLACEKGRQEGDPSPKAAEPKPLPPVLVDGSSTVEPITRAILDLYAPHLVTDIRVQVSGTGGGFKKFCRKEADLSGASRPITSTEAKLCGENGVQFVELPIAFDGVALVVPRSNTWLGSLTVSELRKIWNEEGAIKTYRDVRSSFQNLPLTLAGPGIDSGTFDFFAEAVCGGESKIRADYSASEDDAAIAKLVAGSPGGLGYFGLAHAIKNASSLRIIPVDDENDENGKGPILPTAETIIDGTYQPLSRTLFLYVSLRAAERKEVSHFVEFYLRAARLVARDLGYVGLPEHLMQMVQKRYTTRQTGSALESGAGMIGVTLSDLLQAETVTAQTKPARATDAEVSQR